MASDAIHQRSFTKVSPAAFRERELDIVLPGTVPFQHLAPQAHHLLGHLHALERGIIANALEKGNTIPRPAPPRRAQHPMRRARTHTLRQCLQPLPDGHHQRARHRRTVDPLAQRILNLQSAMLRRLQQVARQHTVLVRSHPLRFFLPVLDPEFRKVGIFDDLQLVLLRLVKEMIERVGRQPDGFGYQAREEHGHLAHPPYVVFIDGPEAREGDRIGPLVRGEEVMIEGIGGLADRVRRRNIDLFAPVRLEARDFVAEFIIAFSFHGRNA